MEDPRIESTESTRAEVAESGYRFEELILTAVVITALAPKAVQLGSYRHGIENTWRGSVLHASEVATMTLQRPVAAMRYSDDGRSLLVLTDDQTAYVLAVP